jgi:RimJ/RimL family protein N-acetyltransferase
MPGSPGWSAIASLHDGPEFPREVETERLLLRQFRQSDLDAYAQLLGDQEIARYFPDGTLPRDQAWRHMSMLAGHWSLLGYGRWAVELKRTGEFIGRAGLWFPEGWPEIELGWVIARPHWGNGYAGEAAAPGLALGFEVLGVTHVASLILPGNSRSIRVAEKLGGVYERQIAFQGGDTLVYGYQKPPP